MSFWSRSNIYARVSRLEERMTQFANDQAHLEADVANLGTAIDTDRAEFAKVIADLKAQIAAGTPAPALNFATADALVAKTQAEATADAPPVAAPPVAPTA